ncbi:Protein RGS-3 c, partial [Aphelenchoides avenae]
KLKQAVDGAYDETRALDQAHKEIYKHLENDQFPRFRRSTIYFGFLEKLLPRSYAEKWKTDFKALLDNQVGRHYFRQYLFTVNAEEYLRFWEAVIEFRQIKDSPAVIGNVGRAIQSEYLLEGAHKEVHLPLGFRDRIAKKVREKAVDVTLFDEAVKHVEEKMKAENYTLFIQSKAYVELLQKLR